MTRPDFRLILASAVALAVSAPATAQMNMPGMSMPGMKMPMPAKKKRMTKKPAAKKDAAKSPAKKAAAKKGPAKKAPTKPRTGAKADPMAGHDMSSMPGMDMPTAKPADPMAGHDVSSMPGLDMPGMANVPPSGTDLSAGNAPPPSVPTDHAADIVYGAPNMAMGRHHLKEGHGGQKVGQVMFNLAEAQFRKGRDGFEWNGEAWYGGDINRVWLKSEGDGAFGKSVDRAEVQALYSHAIGPYFNLQGGVRYDFKPNPSRVYATVGVEGLAPGFFELEGALFLSNKGELLARAEGYYDQRITQRLILQPRAELNFAAQSSRETGIGSGLSNAEIGMRLRYDIRREFAPYVGVQYSCAFGDTRRFMRDAGEDPAGWSILTGIRAWF
ncbi:copper resistance protein B [Sphingomonas sp.]|uniref:copper resistance protein B n=1 Tax=Sphingomonas sp. TaxID=28214 RepID=UPI00286B0375|nr:copper resistance protein B [Sphingomonas sp.]